MMEQWRDELYHHGIKGQKWGDRNGPPYPLDEDDHSAKERKVGWKKSLNDGVDDVKQRKPSNEGNNSLTSTSSKTETTDNTAAKNTGVKTARKSFAGVGFTKPYKNEDEFRSDILQKNPNAAIVDPRLKSWIKDHKKELIAGGIVAASAAILAYTAYNKHGLNIPANNKLGKTVVDAFKNEKAPRIVDGIDFAQPQNEYLAAWLYGDAHRFDAITPEEFAKIDNSDAVCLKAGAAMYRMTDKKYKSLRNDIEYVSFGDDRDRYKAFLPQMWSVSRGRTVKSTFEMDLRAKKDIKAPGKKESIEIMKAALKKAYPGYSEETYNNDILTNFYAYQMNLIDRNNKLGQYYFKELKLHGYNACIDYNDAGRLSDRPLILLNGSASAKVKNVNKIARRESNNLFKRIKPVEAQKDFSVDDYLSLKDKDYRNLCIQAYTRGV